MLGVFHELQSLKRAPVPPSLALARAAGAAGWSVDGGGVALVGSDPTMSSLRSSISANSGVLHRHPTKAGWETRGGGEEESVAEWKAKAVELERLLALAQMADAVKEKEREQERAGERAFRREFELRSSGDGVERGERADSLRGGAMNGGSATGAAAEGSHSSPARRFSGVAALGGVVGGARAAFGGLVGDARAKLGVPGGLLSPANTDKTAEEAGDVRQLQKTVDKLRNQRLEVHKLVARQRAHGRNSENLLEAARDVLGSACCSIPPEQQGELAMVMELLQDLSIELKVAGDDLAALEMTSASDRRKTM